MNKSFKLINRLLLLSMLVIFSGGCTTTMSLQYAKPPAEMMNRGSIVVVVNDQRPPEEGGNEPMRVGTIRNTFGMPFALNAKSDRMPKKVIQELVSDCLVAAGYEISNNQSNVPILEVGLQSFWGDGYQYNKIWSKIHMALKKNGNSVPRWEQTVESTTGVVWTVGYGPFDDGINTMLEDLKKQILTTFKDPKFQSEFDLL
jgi:hypothetical protein